MSLKNRTVVISGATGGLGSILVRDLAAQNTNLALLDIDATKLTSLTDSLSLSKPRFLARTVNLLDAAETKATAEAIFARFGHIDILLHVVGGWTGGKSLLEIPRSDLEFMLNQHIWTSFNVIQAFVPYIIDNGWGRIIMVSSPYASRPTAKGGSYSIGKAGQEALMLTLSQELIGTGVTANLVLAKTIDIKREKISAPSPGNASWTTPEELTAAILYLLSEEAGSINGARIPLFGSF